VPEKRSVIALGAYIVIGFAIGVGAAVFAHNYRVPPIFGLYKPMDGTDDQPPIIVRNGSLIFEAGDSDNPNKGQDTWTKVDSSHWKADHSMGFDVTGFTVYVAGVIDPANCKQTTIRADDVEIDYTTGSSQMVFHVTHEDDGTGKHTEPHVHANAAVLAPPPGVTLIPQLLADANGNGTGTGTGLITRVASDDPNGKPLISCSFPKPGSDAERNLVRITVVPERR
jgi:hypothetical protein